MIRIDVSPDAATLSLRAAALAASTPREVLAQAGEARIVLATGASQIIMLERLLAEPGIDWSRVTAFHLDEYVGLSDTHPASFRRYLRERFVAHAPGVRFHPITPDSGIATELTRLEALISAAPVDLCLAGVGENCHLAFNDPPADFEAQAAFLLVTLDEACRRQQLGEGWFARLEDVPTRAVSMSVRQILRSRRIVLSVPDARKACAVRDMIGGDVTPLHPASILRGHPDATLFLDPASAALLPFAPLHA